MNQSSLFTKTPKGIEEFERRAHKLPYKLRCLLIMVDGSTPAQALIEKAAALGDVPGMLAELETQGFIEDMSGGSTGVPGTIAETRERLMRALYDTLGADAELLAGKARKLETVGQLEGYLQSCVDTIREGMGRKKADDFLVRLEALKAEGLRGRLPERKRPEQSRTAAQPQPSPAVIAEIKRYMVRCVNDTLGPNGEMLALRIEKTRDFEALAALAKSSQEALQAMAGRKKAEEFGARLQRLLGEAAGSQTAG